MTRGPEDDHETTRPLPLEDVDIDLPSVIEGDTVFDLPMDDPEDAGDTLPRQP